MTEVNPEFLEECRAAADVLREGYPTASPNEQILLSGLRELETFCVTVLEEEAGNLEAAEGLLAESSARAETMLTFCLAGRDRYRSLVESISEELDTRVS